MVKHIVFGGQGFIGQNLIKCLLAGEHGLVLSIDKNIWGLDFEKTVSTSNSFLSLNLDICINYEEILHEIKTLNPGEDVVVWHLAANSDIQKGVNDLNVDLQDTFLTTVKILDICKYFKFRNINFASSSAVYGDWGGGQSYKETDLTQPISNYGAMKLASEAVLSASHVSFMSKVNIFRFPNVIGAPATHGVIADFIKKLIATKSSLEVLGDGNQNKPYLHVDDLVSAMLFLFDNTLDGFHVHNIASNSKNVYVHEIAREVVSAINPSAKIKFGSTKGGWTGDVPQVCFNTEKLNALGWTASMSGHEAVKKTILQIIKES